MSRVSSYRISQFLNQVKRGFIVATPRTSGEVELPRIVDALKAILQGEDPDSALQITRRTNATSDRTLDVATIAYHRRHKENPEKWVVIEHEINEILHPAGERMSQTTIKNHYRAHRERIEKQVGVDALALLMKRQGEEGPLPFRESHRECSEIMSKRLATRAEKSLGAGVTPKP